MKKKISLLLVLALVLCLFTPSVQSEAAVRISKKKALLEVGSTLALKMKDTNKTVTWSTSDKSIATVSKGKVTAVAEGTAKIVATVAGKSYTCVVNVVDSSKTIADEFSEKGVIKKLKATTKATYATKYSKYIFINVKNGSDYSINADLSIDLLDKNGNVVEVKKKYLSNFAAGDSSVLVIMTETNVTDYEITYTVKESAKITSIGNCLDVSAKIGSNNVVITATNNGFACVYDPQVLIFCYDADGNLIDYIQSYLYPTEHDGSYLNPGESVKVSRSIYTKIASVKVINIDGYRYR